MYGNELLETIGTLAPDGATAAILRHAARFPIADPAHPTLAEITPDGAAAAEAMGRRITGFDRVRLFHSPVKRCRQTAECIARGALAAGVEIEYLGPEDALGVDYLLNLPEAGRLTTLYGDHFVRLWLSGQIPENVVLAPKLVAGEKLKYLAGRLTEPSNRGRRLDLHVSHDWNILILRELMLGVRHEDVGWLTFLDGISFSFRAGRMEAVYRDCRKNQPMPWQFCPTA